jgi:hypothetical protein
MPTNKYISALEKAVRVLEASHGAALLGYAKGFAERVVEGVR